jgi:hypothetical protein
VFKILLIFTLGLVLGALLLPALLRAEKCAKSYDISEALGILGLTNNPTKEQIIRAHRDKMRIHHPDLGGNQFIAAKINWAKDVLVKGLN